LRLLSRVFLPCAAAVVEKCGPQLIVVLRSPLRGRAALDHRVRARTGREVANRVVQRGLAAIACAMAGALVLALLAALPIDRGEAVELPRCETAKTRKSKKIQATATATNSHIELFRSRDIPMHQVHHPRPPPCRRHNHHHDMY
jgi:hypothetical protein